MQAALALVEKGPQQDRAEDHEREPEQERVEGRNQGRHLAAEPHADLEPQHPLADVRTVRAADGERVITEAHGGKDGAEEEPGERDDSRAIDGVCSASKLARASAAIRAQVAESVATR